MTPMVLIPASDPAGIVEFVVAQPAVRRIRPSRTSFPIFMMRRGMLVKYSRNLSGRPALRAMRFRGFHGRRPFERGFGSQQPRSGRFLILTCDFIHPIDTNS